MGTRISVASTVYSLNGDEESRPNYLKTSLFSAVIAGDKDTFIGESITSNYLNGPSIDQRQFFNWAKRTDYAGLPDYTSQVSSPIDAQIVSDELGVPSTIPDLINQIQSITISSADFVDFAEAYLLENNPTAAYDDWLADYDPALNEITIEHPGGQIDRFIPTDFNINEEYLVVRYYRYLIDAPETPVGGYKILIYRIGSGNVIYDSLVNSTSLEKVMFPFIPIRLNNVSITDTKYVNNGLYDSSKEAYRRASKGQSFQEIIDQIEENDSIDDIDYAYIHYGMALNTQDNSGKHYIYEFFKQQINTQEVTHSEYQTYLSNLTEYGNSENLISTWTDAQNDPNHVLYDTPFPEYNTLGSSPSASIRVNTTNTQTSDFDMRISWGSIIEESFIGLSRPEAKKGDVWFSTATVIPPPAIVRGGAGNVLTERNNSGSSIYMYRQDTNDSFTRMTIFGLRHRNYIYRGKYVEIFAHNVLDDPETSGFIVPLNYKILKEVGIVHATQIAGSAAYMVINSFEVTKTSFFKSLISFVIIIIVVVIATAVLGPVGFGATGLLGSSAAVGASIGLTGTAALIAGAALNTIAALVVSKVISATAVAVLGDKLGLIVGSIASFAATGGLQGGIANIGSIENILALSNVLANGYAGWVGAEVQDINDEIAKNQTEFEEQQEKINDLFKELGGTNDLYFDPMVFTDVIRGNGLREHTGYTPEALDEFIHRTTLSGSDIVEITLSMITDYTDIQLQLPKE